MFDWSKVFEEKLLNSYWGVASSVFVGFILFLHIKWVEILICYDLSSPLLEYLLSPSTGHAKVERQIQEKYFPTDYNFFQVDMPFNPNSFFQVDMPFNLNNFFHVDMPFNLNNFFQVDMPFNLNNFFPM